MARNSNRALSSANRTADNADGVIDRMMRKIDGGFRDAKSRIDYEVTNRVREMLVLNLTKSGVGRDTGKLRSAVMNATVIVNLSSRPKIVISLPEDIKPYENKNSESNFYKAAAAVNYGSVRGAKNARKNDKRREKIAARKTAKKHGIEGSIGTFSGATATKAFGYWNLTGQQQDEIAEMVQKAFVDVVFKPIGQ